VLIVHNMAIDEEVNEALQSAGIDSYTKFPDVLGKGKMSVPHLKSEVWPETNCATLVIAEADKALSLKVASIKKEVDVADAQAVVDVLESRYGFRARPLLNATKGQMLTALNDYRKLLTEDDSLLIYYAGHGTIDRDLLRGYWQPVDASRDDDSTWIDGDEISKQIEGMKARHVLVVADSCYSGALTRGGGVELKRGTSAAAEIKRLTLLSRMPSRTVLTSGGEQPVLDAGGGGHSIFATAFLQVLRTNGQVLDGSAVYNQLFDQVRRTAAKYKVDQSPRYTALREAGHLEGEFLFIPVT